MTITWLWKCLSCSPLWSHPFSPFLYCMKNHILIGVSLLFIVLSYMLGFISAISFFPVYFTLDFLLFILFFLSTPWYLLFPLFLVIIDLKCWKHFLFFFFESIFLPVYTFIKEILFIIPNFLPEKEATWRLPWLML